jgi:integrase
VSWMLSQGVPVMNISRMVGHSSATVTLDVYGHLLPGGNDDAVRRLDQMLADAV